MCTCFIDQLLLLAFRVLTEKHLIVTKKKNLLFQFENNRLYPCTDLTHDFLFLNLPVSCGCQEAFQFMADQT
uniref:Uncharacterized protein n=1 Tax=Anguilla anguilla TaxID=7936 RepID=A0A0E9UIV4_ANGAN